MNNTIIITESHKQGIGELRRALRELYVALAPFYGHNTFRQEHPTETGTIHLTFGVNRYIPPEIINLALDIEYRLNEEPDPISVIREQLDIIVSLGAITLRRQK